MSFVSRTRRNVKPGGKVVSAGNVGVDRGAVGLSSCILATGKLFVRRARPDLLLIIDDTEHDVGERI